MKVLWCTNVPMPAGLARAGIASAGMSGHWMASLAHYLSIRNDIKIAIVTAFPGVENCRFEDGRVCHYLINQPRRFPTFADREVDMRKVLECVSDFRPDLVHVHGTERFYGLLKVRKMISVPEVISLQGLLGPYSSYTNFFGALTPTQILASTTIVELVLGLGLLWDYRRIRSAAQRETSIMRSADAFLGRTGWDKSQARAINPDVPYCHVGEILRPIFARTRWKPSRMDRNTIIFTNAGHPRRGTEILLGAIQILKREFPDVRLRLIGRISEKGGYGRFLRELIRNMNLQHNIDMLGAMDADQMAGAMAQAHVFAIASFIENSPNSLGEAMMIGMPCIGSFVGGIPDMLEHGKSGLLVPSGDAALLAEAIRTVFLNDDLAVAMGNEGRNIALHRHDPETVVNQLMFAYRAVLDSSSIRTSAP